MIKELLKPLEWQETEIDGKFFSWVTKSALHDYQILYDHIGKEYAAFYYLHHRIGGLETSELKIYQAKKSSPPHRWLRNVTDWIAVSALASPPHRWLRNISTASTDG